jgi:hypothetical protein
MIKEVLSMAARMTAGKGGEYYVPYETERDANPSSISQETCPQSDLRRFTKR